MCLCLIFLSIFLFLILFHSVSPCWSLSVLSRFDSVSCCLFLLVSVCSYYKISLPSFHVCNYVFLILHLSLVCVYLSVCVHMSILVSVSLDHCVCLSFCLSTQTHFFSVSFISILWMSLPVSFSLLHSICCSIYLFNGVSLCISASP